MYIRFIHLINVDLISEIVLKLSDTSTILRKFHLSNENEKDEKSQKPKKNGKIDKLPKKDESQKVVTNSALSVKNSFFKRISVLFARQEILHGPGQTLEIDEKGNIQIFYVMLLDCLSKKAILEELNEENEKMMILLLERFFVLRKQLNLESVASFIKIISKLCLLLHGNARFCSTLLFINHKLMSVSLFFLPEFEFVF